MSWNVDSFARRVRLFYIKTDDTHVVLENIASPELDEFAVDPFYKRLAVIFVKLFKTFEPVSIFKVYATVVDRPRFGQPVGLQEHLLRKGSCSLMLTNSLSFSLSQSRGRTARG